MNKIMKNNAGDEFEVIKEFTKYTETRTGRRKWDMWIVRFTETGYTTEVYKYNAEKGKVRDKYKISFCGHGYEGDFDKEIPHWKQARRLWSNMIKRCYDENYTTGYYGRGVTVDARWKCFAHFLEDLPKLENFQEWLDGFEEGNPRYNLDKDLKCPGNKVYCRQCCGFVLEGINKSAGARNGKPYTKKSRVGKK